MSGHTAHHSRCIQSQDSRSDPKGATIYTNSNHVGETGVQQVKRRVPSGVRAVARSDGSCLHCEIGSRPTWERLLECTQLKFDAIDFSEIPQTMMSCAKQSKHDAEKLLDSSKKCHGCANLEPSVGTVGCDRISR